MKALLLTLSLVMIPSSFAYVEPSYSIGDTKIAFYDTALDNEECFDILTSLPEGYFDGLHRINVFNSKYTSVHLGYYYIGGVIHLYDGCTKDTFYHEMAHHYCVQNYKYLGHGGTFLKCLNRIS